MKGMHIFQINISNFNVFVLLNNIRFTLVFILY